jgi:hypothetical protein
MELVGLSTWALVAAEWLAVGCLSGLSWPGDAFWAPRWALWLLSGAFLIGLAQLLLALVGIGFGSVPLVLVVAAIAALVVRVVADHYTRYTGANTSMPAPLDAPERAAWLGLGVLLVAATVRSFVVPEAGWDAFSHWGLKAQAFTVHGTIVSAGTVHEYYPPMVPLLEAWLSLHGGAVSIDFMKLVWPLVGAAFAICLAWHVRLAIGPTWLAPAFAIGILLGTTQLLEGFWTGQADLALTAYLTLATLAAWQWLHTADRRWLVHVALFGAATALTKYEGLPRVGIVVLALLVEALLARCRKHVQPALVLGVAAVVGYLPWLAFRWLHGIGATSEHISQFQPAALGAVLVAVLAVLGGVRTGGGVLAVALAWLTAGRQLLRPAYRLLTLVVLGQLVATLVAFLISETAPDVQARTSATRLIEHFLPVALFASALWLSALLRPASSASKPTL